MNFLFRGAETWTKSRIFKTAKYNSRGARVWVKVVVGQMDTMLIYNQMRCFCWQKDKVLIFSMILVFQRRHEEGAKKVYRRETLPDAYFAGKQVVVCNGAIVLIFCGLWEYRRGFTERSPKGHP